MSSPSRAVKDFWYDEHGGESVEWALVVGLLVLGITGLVAAINTDVRVLLTGIADELNAAAN